MEKNIHLNDRNPSDDVSPIKSTELKRDKTENSSSGFKTPQVGKSMSSEDQVNQSASFSANVLKASNASLLSNKGKFKFNATGNNTPHGYYPFLVSLSYKINSIIGGTPLKLNNTYSREGSISFMTRTGPVELGNAYNSLYSLGAEFLESKDKDKDDKAKEMNIFIVESMRKYLTRRWSTFFDSTIADKVKLFEKKLGEEEKNEENDGEHLDLYGQEVNNRDNEDDDLLKPNFLHNKNIDFFSEMESEKDSESNNINTDFWSEQKITENGKEDEVNLNEFEFEQDKTDKKINVQNVVVDELDTGKKENPIFNDINFWGNMKEGNTYFNQVGDEALKELEGL